MALLLVRNDVSVLLPRSRPAARISVILWRQTEANAKTAIFTTLLFELADVDQTHFTCPIYMSAAAGLAVDGGSVAYADEPYAPGADRRTYILRLHEPRVVRQIVVSDPAREDRMVGFNKFH